MSNNISLVSLAIFCANATLPLFPDKPKAVEFVDTQWVARAAELFGAEHWDYQSSRLRGRPWAWIVIGQTFERPYLMFCLYHYLFRPLQAIKKDYPDLYHSQRYLLLINLATTPFSFLTLLDSFHFNIGGAAIGWREKEQSDQAPNSLFVKERSLPGFVASTAITPAQKRDKALLYQRLFRLSFAAATIVFLPLFYTLWLPSEFVRNGTAQVSSVLLFCVYAGTLGAFWLFSLRLRSLVRNKKKEGPPAGLNKATYQKRLARERLLSINLLFRCGGELAFDIGMNIVGILGWFAELEKRSISESPRLSFLYYVALNSCMVCYGIADITPIILSHAYRRAMLDAWPFNYVKLGETGRMTVFLVANTLAVSAFSNVVAHSISYYIGLEPGISQNEALQQPFVELGDTFNSLFQ